MILQFFTELGQHIQQFWDQLGQNFSRALYDTARAQSTHTVMPFILFAIFYNLSFKWFRTWWIRWIFWAVSIILVSLITTLISGTLLVALYETNHGQPMSDQQV
jgi:hypothetical protein